MKRRRFLASAGLATGAVATLAAPAIAQAPLPSIKWRLQSSYPKSLETLYGTCVYLADLVSQATEGRFKLELFAAGEIVPALQVADAVGSGTVEMGQTGSYFDIGKDMGFAALLSAAVPVTVM